MKTTKLTLLLLVLFTGVISCNKEKDIDTEKPSINIDFTGSFPENCDTLYFGEAFNLKVKFTDNVELGSFSIGIHHNFDHHSHTTEVTECSLDPVKEPVNAFTFIEDYEIAAGLGEYLTDMNIAIPSGDANGPFDEGDYHFFISLTDHEGWSNQKGLSIKMLHK